MAHNSDYTKIWDPSGTEHGLSVYEVMRCLGANTQDVGLLCKSQLVNMWAKFKPVRNSSEATRGFNIAKRNYGLNIPTYNSIESMANAIYNDSVAWEYQKPRGSSYSEPYRLLDFDGYYHNAEQPVLPAASQEIALPFDSDLVVRFPNVAPDSNYPTDCFRMSDVHNGDASDLFIGICYKEGGTYHFWTNGNAASYYDDALVPNYYFSANISMSHDGDHNIVAFMFLSTVQLSLDQPSAGTFIPIPHTRSTLIIKPERPLLSMAITSWRRVSGNIEITVKITNGNTSKVWTCWNNAGDATYEYSVDGTSYSTWGSSVAVSSFNISGGSEVSKTITISGSGSAPIGLKTRIVVNMRYQIATSDVRTISATLEQ